MTISEIYRKGEINVRSFNICTDNRLNTLEELKTFLAKHSTFKKLRNCGNKSNEELIAVCEKYQLDNEDLIFPEKEENPLEKIIIDLSRTQREIINSFITVNTKSLSNRSKNAVSIHIDDNFKIKKFAERIFFKPIPIESWTNIGKKSIPEIEIYLNIIKDFVIEVSQTKDEKNLISLKNKFLIQNTFAISNIPNNILEAESIFLLTDFLLKNNHFYSERDTNILIDALILFNNNYSQKSLDQIALDYKLTRQRIEGIRKNGLKNLLGKLLFIQNFNDNLLQKYNIDSTLNQIEMNSTTIDLINSDNNINLSSEFIFYILFAYLKESYSLIGNIEDLLQPKYFNSRNRHNWNNFHLIKKEITESFDFNSLANDIDKRTNDRIEETYSFNFKSYLSQFLKINKTEILNKVFPIAENILNDEFELYLDLDENLIFKRNTLKQVPEYAIEALEEFGEPSKIGKIYDWIETKHPGVTRSKSALRGSCQRTAEIIYFGRSSTYGLRKWESTLENIKGGTDKDIIIEYLEDKSEPSHISTILKHLNKYRVDKDSKSVLTNLKVDPKKRFIIFNQGFIGLKVNKNKYSIKYESLPVQLGKTIIAYSKKGYSKKEMQIFLQEAFGLTSNESILIINNLKYFNEN